MKNPTDPKCEEIRNYDDGSPREKDRLSIEQQATDELQKAVEHIRRAEEILTGTRGRGTKREHPARGPICGLIWTVAREGNRVLKTWPGIM